MRKNGNCQSRKILIKEVGGVLKTARALSEAQGKPYNISNLYRWRDRGFIPPIWWDVIVELSNGKVTLRQLLNEYKTAHGYEA